VEDWRSARLCQALHVGAFLALWTAACGARTSLEVGFAEEDAAMGVSPQDARVPDAGEADTRMTSPPDADSAPSCRNACALGSRKCDATSTDILMCTMEAGGCTTWELMTVCSSNETCAASTVEDAEVDYSCACKPGYGPADGGDDGGCVLVGADVGPPRPIAPLSTSTVTSQQPVLRWERSKGLTWTGFDVSRDRIFSPANIVSSGTTIETSISFPTPLEPGVYFWRLTGGGPTASPVTGPSPVWEFLVGARSASVNTSWGTTLDLNGDGFADVIVGDTEGNGAVYVYLGGAGGLSTTPVVLTGSGGANEEFGISVASAGDVNGDGFADVVVGARDNANGSGTAYLYLGGAAGLTGTPTVLTGPDGLGVSLASAGDVNGDGYADVLVAGYDTDAVDLYLGGAAGLSTTPVRVETPGGADGLLGPSIASAGDVNGDGFGDVVIGSYGFDGNTGSVYLYLGGTGGLNAMPMVLTGPGGSDGGFGFSVAGAGDVNGDGFADVIVSAVWNTTDPVDLYFGAAAGIVTAPVAVAGPTSSCCFGGAVAGAAP
jgi:hypothetical protein